MTAAASRQGSVLRTRKLAETCLQAHDDPYRALHLAVRITRWKAIVNLEMWPLPDEVLPLHVVAARDRQLRAA